MHQVNSQVSDTGEMNKQLTKEVPLEDQVRADRQNAPELPQTDGYCQSLARRGRKVTGKKRVFPPTRNLR